MFLDHNGLHLEIGERDLKYAKILGIKQYPKSKSLHENDKSPERYKLLKLTAKEMQSTIFIKESEFII